METKVAPAIPPWLLDPTGQLNGVKIMDELAVHCEEAINNVIGRKWSRATHSDPYLQRIWKCVTLHGSKYGGNCPVRLSVVLNELQSWKYGAQGRSANLIADVCFAQALESEEPTAIKTFDTTYKQMMERVCVGMIRKSSREVSENLLSELMRPRETKTKLAAIATYVGRASFRSWLTAVTTRLCLDHIKKSNREIAHCVPSTEVVESISPSVSNVDSIESSDCLDLLRPRFRAAAAAISSKERALLKFVLIDQLAGHEIAERLGVNPGNVTRGLQRTVSRLRAMITGLEANTSVLECMDQILTSGDHKLKHELSCLLMETEAPEQIVSEEMPA